jgi:hypothetical protein
MLLDQPSRSLLCPAMRRAARTSFSMTPGTTLQRPSQQLPRFPDTVKTL